MAAVAVAQWSNDTWLKRVLGESGREGLQTAASFVQYGCKFCGAIVSGMLVERTCAASFCRIPWTLEDASSGVLDTYTGVRGEEGERESRV